MTVVHQDEKQQEVSLQKGLGKSMTVIQGRGVQVLSACSRG